LTAAIYNTASGDAVRPGKENDAVAHCPDCEAEIDLDEDEVEEGEILSCPECDVELEVVQTHPVKLNIASDDDEDLEEEDDEGLLEEDEDEEDEEEEEEDEEE
jgi:alpha-aminoadipate carrier protein LysW